MFIQAVPSGPFATNAYIIGCPDTHKAIIIDPAPDSSEQIVNYLSENHLTPIEIILTHSHWDHIADAAKLKKKFNIPVRIHELDFPNLKQPGADGLPLPFSIEGVSTDQFLSEGDMIHIGNLKFQVIHTPGHSPGSICLYNGEHYILISGDTLFQGTIGNISFPTSQPKLMWTSLDKLAKLPHQTKVYPGHGPSTSIGAETWLPDAQNYFG